MRFEDFIRAKKVRRAEPDMQLSRSLMKMSDNHIKSADELKLSDITSSTIMATCYEALREIVEAITAKEGFKVYSHEAFTLFLREMGEDMISSKFDRFRRIRNNINYYGKPIDASSVKVHRQEIEKTIEQLKERHLKDIRAP